MSLNTSNRSTGSDWFVACAPFLEPLLADELQALGAEKVTVGHAGVTARGPLALGYRALLWSRLASRVSRLLAAGAAQNREQLATLVCGIDWPEHLQEHSTFRVRFSGRNQDFRNTRFGAQWVKDLVVDQFRAAGLARPSVAAEPDLTLMVNLHGGRATVGLELNRVSLHRRGYRPANAPAPIRETLAAAVLIRGGWPAELDALPGAAKSPALTLIDPMCGSGTLLLEAALMAFDWAPGLLAHESLRAPGWTGHDEALWQTLVTQATEKRDRALNRRSEMIRFWGNDTDSTALRAARQSFQALGLSGADWSRNDVGEFSWSPPVSGRVMAIANPPYGERLSRSTALPGLYSRLGAWLSDLPEGRSRAALILAEEAPVAATGLFYEKSYRVRNGTIDCRVYTYPSLQVRATPTPEMVPDVANRIRKNLKRLKPFLRRGSTNAYRIYDADIPEYAVAIDRYDNWLHVQEYAAPKSVPPALAERRLQDMLVTLPEVLDVAPEHMAVKQRQRQSGLQQYGRQGSENVWLTVHENGARLKVNLTDYLDTGLFLDHRPIRHWIQQHSKGQQVLNLFSYTGAASVHAALGGAAEVVSVDLSATYQTWAQDNFRLNNLDPERHRFEQSDALKWLTRTREMFDLIFLDPPTFSNSKRMRETLDIQRDHRQLLDLAMARLRPAGTLVFSTNNRRFRLDESIPANYTVIDHTNASIPPDFERNQRIHQCWLLQHPERDTERC